MCIGNKSLKLTFAYFIPSPEHVLFRIHEYYKHILRINILDGVQQGQILCKFQRLDAVGVVSYDHWKQLMGRPERRAPLDPVNHTVANCPLDCHWDSSSPPPNEFIRSVPWA
jgi:hypothetical protein